MFVPSHSSALLYLSRPISVLGVNRGCWPTASDASALACCAILALHWSCPPIRTRFHTKDHVGLHNGILAAEYQRPQVTGIPALSCSTRPAKADYRLPRPEEASSQKSSGHTTMLSTAK